MVALLVITCLGLILLNCIDFKSKVFVVVTLLFTCLLRRCAEKGQKIVDGGYTHNTNNKPQTIGIKVWDGLDDVYSTDNYKKYMWQAKKMVKKLNIGSTVTGKSRKYNPSVLDTNDLYMLYQHKPDTKKWGNVGDMNLSYKFSDNILRPLPRKGIYVDYGCGSGKLTKAMARFLNAKKSYCVDVDNYIDIGVGSAIDGDDEINFIENKTETSMDDKIKKDTVDLITATQSLHHVNFNATTDDFRQSLAQSLDNFTTKLKPGGMLLIREHDVRNANDLYPVVFEHLLYDLIELKDKTFTKEQLREYIEGYHWLHNGWYFSKDDLHNLIISRGYRLIVSEYKPGGNPSRIYNSLYQKNT
jgi:SAM-dependent methyltransferase